MLRKLKFSIVILCLLWFNKSANSEWTTGTSNRTDLDNECKFLDLNNLK